MKPLSIIDGMSTASQRQDMACAVYSLRQELERLIVSDDPPISLDILLGYDISTSTPPKEPLYLVDYDVEELARTSASYTVRSSLFLRLYSFRVLEDEQLLPSAIEIGAMIVALYGLAPIVDGGKRLKEHVGQAIASHLIPLFVEYFSLARNDMVENHLIDFIHTCGRLYGDLKFIVHPFVKSLLAELAENNYEHQAAVSTMLSIISPWRYEKGKIIDACKSVGKTVKAILEVCAYLAWEREDLMGQDPTIYKTRENIAIRAVSVLGLMFGADNIFGVIGKMIQDERKKHLQRESPNKQSACSSSNDSIVSRPGKLNAIVDNHEAPAPERVFSSMYKDKLSMILETNNTEHEPEANALGVINEEHDGLTLFPISDILFDYCANHIVSGLTAILRNKQKIKKIIKILYLQTTKEMKSVMSTSTQSLNNTQERQDTSAQQGQEETNSDVSSKASLHFIKDRKKTIINKFCINTRISNSTPCILDAGESPAPTVTLKTQTMSDIAKPSKAQSPNEGQYSYSYGEYTYDYSVEGFINDLSCSSPLSESKSGMIQDQKFPQTAHKRKKHKQHVVLPPIYTNSGVTDSHL